MQPRIEVGQFVKFTYSPPEPPPKKEYQRQLTTVKGPDGKPKQVATTVRVSAPPPPPSDRNKEIFVLHPHWKNKVQAIDTKRLSPAEVQVLHAVMDPAIKAAADAGTWPIEGCPNYPLIRDILRRVDPVELIRNPVAFYQQLIKPFIRGKDVYRTYWPQYMGGLQVIQESKVQGHVTNPAPLFKKI